MRKTLMLSAAALGLAIGAPAFAQTTPAAPAPGGMSGTATDSSMGSASMNSATPGTTTQTKHWHQANRAHTSSGMQAQNNMVRPGPCPGRRQFRARLQPGEQYRQRGHAERNRAAPAGAARRRQRLARAAARRGPAGAPPRCDG